LSEIFCDCMKLFAVFLVSFLWLPINPEVYLSKIDGFATKSFFKAEVYAKHDWQSFEKLPEPNELVQIDKFDVHLMNASLFFASNKIRQSKKVAPLAYSESLRNAALVHSNEMVERQFYSHINSKNIELRAPDGRMKMFGISNVLMAENIHRFPFVPNETTYLALAQNIMDDFYKSEGHRQNLMNKNFTHTGCAALWEFSTREKYHFAKVTQCFIRI
jgi:uncharacterized protein YkwD